MNKSTNNRKATQGTIDQSLESAFQVIADAAAKKDKQLGALSPNANGVIDLALLRQQHRVGLRSTSTRAEQENLKAAYRRVTNATEVQHSRVRTVGLV